MKREVTIVDYGVGNLVSVGRALIAAGAMPVTSSDQHAIRKAERLVLPGVGAFGHCMDEIRKRALLEPLLEFARSQRPFLGICVGMQIMFETGDEFGGHAGLGLFPGRVTRIASNKDENTKLKLPIVGWRKVGIHATSNAPAATVLREQDGNWFYFLHSFCAQPTVASNILASYQVNDQKIVAAVAKDQILGVQFHPEKSGADGLSVFSNFLSL